MKKILFIFTVAVALLSVNVLCENTTVSVFNRVEAASVKQVQALHILVPTREEAVKIREEIMQGQNPSEIFHNFMNAARKYSKCPSGASGGILGWFGRGDMVPAFETAAFNLPSGQVSEPVKTQFGWHLIYIISKK